MNRISWLAACSVLALATAARAVPTAPPSSLDYDQAVEAVRAALLGGQLPGATPTDSRSDPPLQLAQWGNWGNWGNWNNWQNWGNWGNWGNY